ncbi:MAG: hypothetical protein CSA11_12225 [Chloroflexi bacterium]|nr:MAG: hypothetical protein CSA11_12225 [Chloroflexota bacterium]
MRKQVVIAGLTGLFTTATLLTGGIIIPTEQAAFAREIKKPSKQSLKIKGKITNISQKAKTIALASKEKSFFLIKFNEQTELKEMASTKELKTGEAVLIHYTTAGEENIAVSIEKAFVKLPAGVTKIKTDELAQRIKNDKNLVIIDARPPAKYAEAHIPSALSIPYAKLAKMKEKGAQLLDKYKGSQLVFYCGGPT